MNRGFIYSMYNYLNEKNSEQRNGISVTKDEIEDFENKYSINLPNYYKKFILDTNGGSIRDELIFNINNDIFEGLDHIYFDTLDSTISWLDQILNNEYDEIGKNLINNKILCIGISSGTGLLIGISTITGKIGIVDYGLTFDTPFFVIADSFEDFINRFEINPDYK